MIRFDSFSKRFGRTCAVESLTLSVGAGEVVALLGPNGSGKTTSLKAAVGLIHPTSGTVAIGDPPRPALEPAARAVVSFLPQKVLFPDSLSGREVVEFYRRLRGVPAERTDAALRFASLNGASERAVGTYSGGMVQRLGLAVVTLPDASVLLLDEPTASLDPDGLCAFYELVEERRAKGKSVLFTSHQLGDVDRLADRFAVLVEGRLVAVMSQGALAERLAERGVMRLRLSGRPSTLLDRLKPLAPDARWAGDELVVPGPASLRPAVLDRVRSEGVEVRGLTAEEGRLDLLYRELVGEER
ncbi:MAG: ABC transporter ATP-binding protein [Thermoanaerobaculaceae bacterium]|nr:ABC transporter ATP-binding protein [Thermoanaerobaculaceae bacterium]